MLTFLKNHYEKIILVCLLIIFAVLLIYQVMFLQTVQTQRVERIISQKDPDTDYKLIDFTAKDFSEAKIYSEDESFKFRKIVSSAKESRFMTDIMAPFQLSACPYCNELIPTSYFPPTDSKEEAQCPICHKQIPSKKSKAETKVEVNVNSDRNSNGVPDEWEEKYGLSVDATGDSAAATFDHDGDGFTLKEHFESNTNPKDPMSHPLYVEKKLFVKNVRLAKINGLKLTRIVVSSDNKQKWEAHFNVHFNRSTRTRFLHIGDDIETSSDLFKIVDIVVPGKDPDAIQKNGYVVIQRMRGLRTKISCKVNTAITDPTERVTFYDAAFKRNFSVHTGETFKIGSVASGEENYRVVSADSRAKTAKVVSTIDPKKEYLIPKYVEEEPVEKTPAEPGSEDSEQPQMIK